MNSKFNVKNILVMFGFLLGSLALVIGLNYVLTPTYEKAELQNKIKEYSVVVEGLDKIEEIARNENDSEYIIEKYKGLNKSDVEIAKIYKASKENLYGSITLIVGVDKDNKITGISSDIDQSMGVKELERYLKSMVRSEIMEPKSLDGTSMPTVAISVGTALELIEDIAKTHNPEGMVELDIYDQLFGEDHEVEKVDLPHESVKYMKKILVDDEVKGYSYYVEKSGIYNSADEDTAYIGMEIILNLENDFIGYKFIRYEHSGGIFQKRVVEMLEELLKDGINFNELPDLDSTAGSTNSKNVIIDIMLELNKYLKELE